MKDGFLAPQDCPSPRVRTDPAVVPGYHALWAVFLNGLQVKDRINR